MLPIKPALVYASPSGFSGWGVLLAALGAPVQFSPSFGDSIVFTVYPRSRSEQAASSAD